MSKEKKLNKLSYAIGISLGQSMVGSGIESDVLEFEDFLQGVKDVYYGADSKISPEEGNQLLKTYFDKVHKNAEEMMKQEREFNLKKAQDYLKENKDKPGVNVTDSGLQYKVLQEGGIMQWPTAHSRVRVHYEGRLTDGEVFDSSYQRNKPAEFNLDQVIPGWTEGLCLMKPGSKYEFTIPPALGYGENGIPGHIPGNSVLIFTVELLDILPATI